MIYDKLPIILKLEERTLKKKKTKFTPVGEGGSGH